MNDIIKLILFNIILIGSLYYDKRFSIPIIVVMMVYFITIKSSIRTKIVEGYGFFDNFVELPEFSKYDYSPTLPNSILHNSQDQGYSSIFSFFNGGGKYSTLKNDRMTTLEETNNLIDQLIGMFEMGQENCKGGFEKFSECSRDCGYGTQEQVYRVTQEKGPNGIDCPYTEGHKIKKPCILRDCDVDEKCRHNYECRSRDCDNGTCKRVGECDEDTLYHCYTEEECVGLNGKYNTDSRNRYEWDSRTNTCSFEYTPQTEYRYFGKPELPESGEGGGEEGCLVDEECNSDQYCDDNNECKNTYSDYFWTNKKTSCNEMCKGLDKDLTCDYESLLEIKGGDELSSYNKLYNPLKEDERWKGGPGGSGCSDRTFSNGSKHISVDTRGPGGNNHCNAPDVDVDPEYKDLCDWKHDGTDRRAGACKCKENQY